jgi:hypothetical protein
MTYVRLMSKFPQMEPQWSPLLKSGVTWPS